jgi:RNA polymerase sigma-70 factor (ECF subfamily)
MLQTVLGLDAARIASAFLTSPTAMGQRLVRAKAKIRDAGLRFEPPDAADLPPRLEAVMEAIYAAYGSGWEDMTGADARRRGLADEAIWLARLLVALLPAEPEPKGLLALMLHCEARRAARRTPEGAYVPLSEQDPRLWSRPMVEEAEALIRTAAVAGRPGRLQLEAALQSLHVEATISGRTDWRAAAQLYAVLVQVSPTVGARVGQAAAVAEAEGPEEGLALLALTPAETYQPWWALKAHLEARLGRREEALAAYGRAIGLSEDSAVRAFLQGRATALG